MTYSNVQRRARIFKLGVQAMRQTFVSELKAETPESEHARIDQIADAAEDLVMTEAAERHASRAREGQKSPAQR